MRSSDRIPLPLYEFVGHLPQNAAPHTVEDNGMGQFMGVEMAEADLDVVIRTIAKKQNKSLMEAAKKRHGQYMARAAKAKDKETKERYKQIAKSTMLHAAAAAKRLQNSADNAADSYARAVKRAAEEAPAKKPVKKKPA
jgi:hypothetical protein